MSKIAFITSDFEEAYKLAAQHPGESISFSGKLPSGINITQTIIKVPDGENMLAYARNRGCSGTRSHSANQHKGSHVVYTKN